MASGDFTPNHGSVRTTDSLLEFKGRACPFWTQRAFLSLLNNERWSSLHIRGPL